MQLLVAKYYSNETSDNNKGEVAHKNECCLIKSLLKQTLRFWFSTSNPKKYHEI